jgi:competence protein ComEA
MIDMVADGAQRLRARFGDRPVLIGIVSVAVSCVLAIALLVGITGRGSSSGTATELTAPLLFDPPSTTTTAPPEVTVHVLGAVRSPGLYRLPLGSRIADAVTAAGGVGEDVDVERVNLAAALLDGQRVYIARLGQLTAPDLAADPVPIVSGDTGGSANGAPALVNLNSATEQELESLPGVGPSTAAAIVALRRQVGRFSSIDQLLDVRGIGEAKLGAIRDLVRIG